MLTDAAICLIIRGDRILIIDDNNNTDATIESEFILPRSLSAMAKTFYVKTDKPIGDGLWYMKQGTTVTGVKVIAKGLGIRCINSLIEKNPLPNGEKTKAKDWYKCRGTADVTNGKQVSKNCEIHFYQCQNIGKIEYKVKIWGEIIES